MMERKTSDEFWLKRVEYMILFASSIDFVYNKYTNADINALRAISMIAPLHNVRSKTRFHYAPDQPKNAQPKRRLINARMRLQNFRRAVCEHQRVRTLSSFLVAISTPSRVGNELSVARAVVEHVKLISADTGLSNRVQTAVAEAIMNGIEHGNGFQKDLLVDVCVLKTGKKLVITVTDQGGPLKKQPVVPNLEAKLAGLQPTRGWGLFLIEKMVDKMIHSSANGQHTLTLIFNL